MVIDRRAMIRTLAAASAGVVDAPLELVIGACGFKDLPGFESFCFKSGDLTRQVYVSDRGGPPVVVLHELPGLIDPDLAFARCLSDAGYTVIAPLLFGEPGGEGAAFKYYRQICGGDRFACNRGEVTSPEVKWLMALVRDARGRWPAGKGVGVVGMCLTGAFPLAMLREPLVVAPVLCQPTVPFNSFSWLRVFRDKDALGISPSDLDHVKTQTNMPILGIRYTGDWRCPRQRFARLTEELKDRFFRLDLEGKHHSTLGGDFSQEALLEVLAYFNVRLRQTPDECAGTFPRRSKSNSHDEVRVQDCECHVMQRCGPAK